MLQSVLIAAGLVILVLAGWYWAFQSFNRRRALLVLRWLEESIAAQGEVSGVDWISPSHFRARLQLPGAFRQPSLDARLAPRHLPAQWFAWRWHRRVETLTFEANLSCAPHHSLEIGRTRWTGLTRRWMPNTGNWPNHPVASLFISTQSDWEPEIAGRMNCVASSRELKYLMVSYRRRTPHFSVTFSLQETLERPRGELAIFDSLRELAEGSPTSRM